jgi:energy-coupling factor transporter ATP-binding protein EcfA2
VTAPQAPTNPSPNNGDDFWVNAMFRLTIFGVVASVAIVLAPMAAAALVFLVFVRTTQIKWWWVALAGLFVSLVLHLVGQSPLETIEQVMEKANRMAEKKGFDSAVRHIWDHKWAWWSRSLPTLAVGAGIGALVAALTEERYPPFDPRAEAQNQKRIELGRRRAGRRLAKSPDAIKGLAVIGPFAHGDLPKPWVQRRRSNPYLCIHPTLLGRHVVLVGKPGSGKTTTLLRLAHLAAEVYGWRVYFLDGKGDVATMHDFTALMLGAGVPAGEVAAFPITPFDGWRVSDDRQGYAQLLNRLMGAVTFTEPYYRDITRRYLSRALKANGTLPSSSQELLTRLESLVSKAPSELKQEAASTHARFEGLFDSFPGQLDGGWSFSDCRAGYVLLKGLANRDQAEGVAGYLFECFKQFATDMKSPADRVLLVVDEFPAVMGDSDAAGMIERLRSFGVGVAISGQSFEGLGPDRTRIVEAAGTLILHRLSASDELARMAGTIQNYAVTSQIDFDLGATGRGTVTPEHRFKAEPNAIGRQADGEITLITDRCVGHGFVTRADSTAWRHRASDLLDERTFNAPPEPDETPSAKVVELR